MKLCHLAGVCRIAITFTMVCSYVFAFGTQVYGASKGQSGKDELDYLEKLYKTLHQNPELSLQEVKTSARLAKELKYAGYEVTTKVGGTGLVGVLKRGAGPVIMIRADMDALPVEEKTGVPFASKVTVKKDGKKVKLMHACGHDMHMAVWAGVARAMSRDKSWKGTLIMVGQPAEEIGAGSKAMIEDGLFTRFPRPDYNLALHVTNKIPAGAIGLVSGYALANVDTIDIVVKGKGGHGSAPHTTKDPIVLASRIVLDLQTIVSREINPLEPAVLTVGSIHGGTKHNIIPGEVKLELTLRSYKAKVRQQILSAIKRISRGAALTAGLPEELMPVVTVKENFTPATYNNPAMVAQVKEAASALLGDKRVIMAGPIMGGEDCGRYGLEEPKIPSVIFWLGGGSYKALKAGKKPVSNHSPYYIPEWRPTIGTGVKVMTGIATHFLNLRPELSSKKKAQDKL